MIVLKLIIVVAPLTVTSVLASVLASVWFGVWKHWKRTVYAVR